jgi:2,5-diketo-D-gluconate reductase A
VDNGYDREQALFLAATFADMPEIPSLTFNNGVEIPQVGFGVFLVPSEETKAAVSSALETGYRHIDTAKIYGNEEAVGEAIAESSVAREDIFVTTKCWNDDQGYDAARKAFDASMQRLGLDYLDLYLIHWPVPSQDRYVETWKAFESLYSEGRVRAIGVSNFQPAHLRRLFDETDTVPAINQIELHPWLQQRELRAFHAEHGIITEAWSPLAAGGDFLDDPTIATIAKKHEVSPAQVILRWHLDLGNVIIPKSVNPSRMASNMDLFGFQLDEDDHADIAGLDKGHRVGPDPDTLE